MADFHPHATGEEDQAVHQAVQVVEVPSGFLVKEVLEFVVDLSTD